MYSPDAVVEVEWSGGSWVQSLFQAMVSCTVQPKEVVTGVQCQRAIGRRGCGQPRLQVVRERRVGVGAAILGKGSLPLQISH